LCRARTHLRPTSRAVVAAMCRWRCGLFDGAFARLQ
jgi:hypothetical protein